MINKKPLVSIIIPTFNSEETIFKCLQSIKNQSYKNYEIIIIDKQSDDRTTNVAKRFGANIYIITANERCDQFNFGVKVSNGEYIYRVDSDFLLEPTIIEEAIKNSIEYDFDAICIHNTPDPNISIWSKVRKFEKDMYKNDDLNVAARFLKKEVFEDIGGFNTDLIAAEDYDLHNRLLKKGFKIGMIEAEEIHIGEPKSIKEIIFKHYYYGKSIGKFLENNRNRGIRQMNPIRPAFIRNWKKFIKNPILTILFIIYQIIRYFSAIIGFFVNRVQL